jgi:hypothetical protein
MTTIAAPDGRPPALDPVEAGSVASMTWHRIVLVVVALVLILVVLPAVLGAAATQALALG